MKRKTQAIDYSLLKAYREQGKAVKPKGNKAKRMAESAAVEARFPGRHQDNIAKVGMR